MSSPLYDHGNVSISGETQQAVADAMAASGAEAVPAGRRVFRPVSGSSEPQSVAAEGNEHEVPER
jgi:hypothetical protein